MTTILSVLLFALALYYFGFLIRIRLGLRRLKPLTPGAENNPFVSILVAARNEASTIESCIRALDNQDYDRSLYEIIVINDGSTDKTAAILESLRGDGEGIRTLTLDDSTTLPKGRKRSALEAGIRTARGEVILTTDADCIVGASWVATMVQSFAPETALVAGPVVQLPGSSLVSKISALEFLGLMTATAGLFGIGKPIVCNGANLAFRKSAFEAAGGYGPLAPFAEDEALLHRIVYRNIGKVLFCPDRQAVVHTQPEPSLTTFWHRRVRWSSKRGQYENPWVYFRLVILYLFFLLLAAMLGYSIINVDFAMISIGIAVAKVLAEFQAVNEGAEKFGVPFSVGHFIIAELFHIPYIVAAALAGQFAPKKWKGTELST